MGTLPLQQQDKGVWSIYLPGDQHGKYYDFTLTTPFGTCNAADPYARAAGVNGVRSMIFDPARVDPQGWERDVRPVIPPARRSVWEVSVRDFSQDPASGVHVGGGLCPRRREHFGGDGRGRHAGLWQRVR